jgi:hypothetical protein
VWVGPLVQKELRRIVDQSEIVKYVLLPMTRRVHILWIYVMLIDLCGVQGRRHELAKEEHCGQAGARDSYQ